MRKPHQPSFTSLVVLTVLPVGRDSQSKAMKSQWVGPSKVRVQGTQVDPIKYIYI